jgi:hypothetical protein
MNAPFAVLEARINAAVDKRLSNAVADFGAGVLVPGVLDAAFASQLNVEGVRPAFSAATVALPAVVHGTTLSILSNTYRVIGIEPDAGRSTLLLERTA